MGDVADDLLDGTMCSLCGCFFALRAEVKDKGAVADIELFSHGFPVVCWDCWKDMTKRERKEHQRATRPTL